MNAIPQILAMLMPLAQTLWGVIHAPATLTLVEMDYFVKVIILMEFNNEYFGKRNCLRLFYMAAMVLVTNCIVI